MSKAERGRGIGNSLLELSKTVDKVGIVGGLGMIALGFIAFPGLVASGAAIAGVSIATYAAADYFQKSGSKKSHQFSAA